MDTQIDTQTHRHTDRHTDKHTDRHTDRQTRPKTLPNAYAGGNKDNFKFVQSPVFRKDSMGDSVQFV